jgi:hypothetical protein
MLEFLFERREAGRGEIDRAPAVMFAVARGSADTQDLRDALAAFELAAQDAELGVGGAVRGNQLQFDVVGRG